MQPAMPPRERPGVMHLDYAHAIAAEGAHRIGLADVEDAEATAAGPSPARRERAARPSSEASSPSFAVKAISMSR
jgi:hypothetical protein